MWDKCFALSFSVFILSQFAFSGPASGQNNSVVQDPAGIVVLTDAAYIVPSFLTMLWVHEAGHYTFAVLCGAQNPRMGVYRVTHEPAASTQYQLGWTDWKEGSLSSFGLGLVDIGGVVFSRGLAEGSDAFVKAVHLPDWGERFFSMTFILSRFDFPRYVLQDALLNLAGRSGSDIDDFVTVVAGTKTGWRVLTYTALLTIGTVDIVLDWDRISMHWNSLGGKTIYHEEAGSSLQLHPFFFAGTVGVNLQASW
jgi:hypothetical protein